MEAANQTDDQQDLDENDDDNLSRQCEEVEALSAIYGDDFIITDEASRMYEVRVLSEVDDIYSVTIQLLLPPQYPSRSPPVFEIHSVWMNKAERRQAMDALYVIYRENRGELVIYQWIEKLREFIDEKARESNDKEKQIDDAVTSSAELANVTSDNPTSDLSDLEEDTVTFTEEEKLPIDPTTLENKSTNNIEIMHGEPFTDRKSTFQSHMAFVSNDFQVRQVLVELMKNRKIAHASHNIMAYRIYNEERGAYMQDCDDDGESAGGSRLLHLLEILKVQNVVVVVSRWYGGILLGPDRFKHINNSARELLKSVGLIENKDDTEKKDPKGKIKVKSKKHK